MSSGNVPLWQQMLAKRREWLASQPSISGQLSAMGREIVKDVRATIHEVFFGRPEHAAEPGSPGNPTQYMINQDLGTVHGNYDHSQDQVMPADTELQKYVTPNAELSQQQHRVDASTRYGQQNAPSANQSSDLQCYVSLPQDSQQKGRDR